MTLYRNFDLASWNSNPLTSENITNARLWERIQQSRDTALTPEKILLHVIPITLCTVNPVRPTCINYAWMPIFSLLSLSKDAVCGHTHPQKTFFSPKGAILMLILTYTCMRNREIQVWACHAEILLCFFLVTGHRMFSMLWGPWNTLLPHRPSFLITTFTQYRGNLSHTQPRML